MRIRTLSYIEAIEHIPRGATLRIPAVLWDEYEQLLAELGAEYHARALSLYAKLGFTVRDVLARVTGSPLARQLPGYTVRPATLSDLSACNAVCQHVHGHDRSGELRDAITQGSATVVEHAGQLRGYATVIGASGHAVGDSTTAVQALISAAPAFERGSFLETTEGCPGTTGTNMGAGHRRLTRGLQKYPRLVMLCLDATMLTSPPP